MLLILVLRENFNFDFVVVFCHAVCLSLLGLVNSVSIVLVVVDVRFCKRCVVKKKKKKKKGWEAIFVKLL